ncbi:hypothetical protein PG994_014009 [Apiospora phragmitis]|uniref:Uncharacterized protein n=1 Tax=Apiospora phragmitis TaxID=2905665 RepID=A0ABR1T3I3_9PEZI
MASSSKNSLPVVKQYTTITSAARRHGSCVAVMSRQYHAWRNPSATEYVRVLCEVFGAEPVVVDE